MEIQDRDKALVDAFFYREINEYLWDPKPWQGKSMIERKADFFDRLWSLTKAIIEPIPSADFIRFESLTNMGLVCRALEISPKQWDYKPGILSLYMPPSPQGGIGHGWKKK